MFNEVEVTAEAIPRFVKQNDNEKSLLLEDIEKQYTNCVMELYNGNQIRSADALGIVLNTLKSKMQKYGLERHDFT